MLVFAVFGKREDFFTHKHFVYLRFAVCGKHANLFVHKEFVCILDVW